ncbi:MGMT family protein [Ferdinandcohnia sp. Marseille-Q9671]
MKPFTENVIQIIDQIPPGRVMTYGQIAKLAGSPRGARQVVRILHTLSKKYNLPWFRVVNAKGEIGIRDEETHAAQVIFLQDEGVEFESPNKIKLAKYQYVPE